jgi:hypothetical protein
VYRVLALKAALVVFMAVGSRVFVCISSFVKILELTDGVMSLRAIFQRETEKRKLINGKQKLVKYSVNIWWAYTNWYPWLEVACVEFWVLLAIFR